MAQRELTSTDYVAMLRRRWILILTLTLIGAPLSYGISRFLPNRYKSQTLVLVQQPTVPTEFVKPVDTTDVRQRLATMQQQIMSRTRLEPVIRQFGLYSADVNRVSMEDLVTRLQAAVEITPVEATADTRGNGLPGFAVSVTLDNAQKAQQVCTTITSMFIEEDLKLRQQHSDDTTQFLSEQLAQAKANLDAQDAKLAAFKSQYFGSLPDESQASLNILTGLTSQLDATTQTLSRAQQDKGFDDSMLAQQVAAFKASETGRDPETLEQQLAASESQLASLEARYTDDYPDVIKIKNDIAALKNRIAESDDPPPAATTTAATATTATTPTATATTPTDRASRPLIEPPQITQLRAQILSYNQVIAEKTKEQERIRAQIKLYQERVQSSPVVEEQYKELTRDYQTALDSYNNLLKDRTASEMGAELERKQEGEQFSVLDPANLPDKPSFPNRPLFALGGLAGGLALGLGLTFFLETHTTAMRTEKDVEFALRLPVLAMVPAIAPVSAKKPAMIPDGKQSNGLQLEIGARS